MAPAAEAAEPSGPGEEKANTLPGHTPTVEAELTAAEIAQFRALQAASFPSSARSHQPQTRTGIPAATDPAAPRAAPSPTAVRGYGR